MDAVWVGIAVAILTFAGGALGLYLQKLLPEEHSAEKSRDMIGSVMGLVTLLLALVLGTIVGSAYFFSATQQAELQALAAQSIQLDGRSRSMDPRQSRGATGEGGDWTRPELFWGGGDVDPGELTMSRRRWAP